jgi:hypothetical protein
MKMKYLTILFLILTNTYLFAQNGCQNAINRANFDFQNSEYSFHSTEILPVENTYFYVLSKYYNINWYFTDSIDYYSCYDSVMTIHLKEKLGNNFLKRAHAISDSLDNTENWRKDAQYPGGQAELLKFISSRLNGEYIKRNFTKTKVILLVDIDSTGQVTNPKVMRGINHKFDKKVIEIARQLPRFEPGYLYGKPIRQVFYIPINLEYK